MTSIPEKTYGGGWNFVFYLTTFGLLWLTIVTNHIWLVVSTVTLFAIWDFGYAFSPSAYAGRDGKDILVALRRCRDYMAWFIVFYAILFSSLIAHGEATIELLRAADVSIYRIVLPFTMLCIGIMFVPAKLMSDSAADSPSRSLMLVFSLAAFIQQASMFLLATAIGRALIAFAS